MSNIEKKDSKSCYFPEEVELVEYRGKLILVDKKLWDYGEESIVAIIPTGRNRSSFSDFMLEGFAEKLVEFINKQDM